MKVFSGLALCAILISQYAAAQAHSNSSEIRSADQDVEVFGGFALAGGGSLGTGYGASGGLDFRVHPRVFIVVDLNEFSSQSPSSSNSTYDTAFLFGPRYIVARPSSRTSVFGQFLVGADSFHNGGQPYTYQYNTATNFAIMPGGGLDYALSRHLGARLTGGFLHSRLANSTYGGPVTPSTVGENRGVFVADVVYRFGRH